MMPAAQLANRKAEWAERKANEAAGARNLHRNRGPLGSDFRSRVMPKFHLDVGSPDAARTYSQLDAFTQSYIEAMFFTDASSADDGDLENATFADLAPSFLERIISDCQRFQTEHAALLDRAYSEHDYEDTQAGRDYWFTRNGHGVGFWDRGLGKLGDELSAAARYSPVDIHLGDDGQVWS